MKDFEYIPESSDMSSAEVAMASVALGTGGKINLPTWPQSPSSFPNDIDGLKVLDWQSMPNQETVKTDLTKYYKTLSEINAGTVQDADLHNLKQLLPRIRSYVLTEEDYNLIASALLNVETYIIKYLHDDLLEKASQLDGFLGAMIFQLNAWLETLVVEKPVTQDEINRVETLVTNFTRTFEAGLKTIMDDRGYGTTKVISGNMNDNIENGIYVGNNIVNAPTNDWYFFEVKKYTNSHVVQVATYYGEDIKIYIRHKLADRWYEWETFTTSKTEFSGIAELRNNWGGSLKVSRSGNSVTVNGAITPGNKYNGTVIFELTDAKIKPSTPTTLGCIGKTSNGARFLSCDVAVNGYVTIDEADGDTWADVSKVSFSSSFIL